MDFSTRNIERGRTSLRKREQLDDVRPLSIGNPKLKKKIKKMLWDHFDSWRHQKKKARLLADTRSFRCSIVEQKYSGDLYSKHWNIELIWIANFYLFGIQMVANWTVLTLLLVTMVKSKKAKGHMVTKLFTIQIVNYKIAIQDMAWITDHSRNQLFWTIWIPN